MISSTGIGSGLDVNGIITQLMAIERRPLQLLETEKSALNTQLSTFGKMQGLMSAMRDRANSLTSLTLWNRTTGTSSDPTAVSVSTGSSSATGNYSVSVQKLAAAQTISSRAFTSSTEPAFTPGTLTIELGSWTGDPASGFATKAGATAVPVTIGPDDDTLAEVRDRINAAGAGVTASIINDANGSRLAIRSKDTGAENAFRISASETADDGVAANGLSALSFDLLGGPSQMGRNQTAANALATVNGIAIESASNVLADVSDGVTLTLFKESATPVEVGVTTDTAAVKTALEDFVKAFNELASFIREQTKYDEATKKAGALQGDRTAVGLQGQLRAVLNQASSASGVFGRLSDIGIVMKGDGTLETKSGALTNALANLGEMRKLLATDGTTNADTGFMQRFKELGDATLGIDGSFESRNSSLKSRIERNDDRQEQMTNRLAQTEKRMRAQYEALDANMAKLTSMSNYMAQQLQAMYVNQR